jgi:hypothetical protein
MQVSKAGHARIVYNHKPLVTYSKWSEDLKSNSSMVHCVGVTAISKKPTEVTITWTNAVLVNGEEQDYRAVLKSGAIVDMEVWETGGWKPMYRGILNSYKRDDGVDTDPTSDVGFVGVSIG